MNALFKSLPAPTKVVPVLIDTTMHHLKDNVMKNMTTNKDSLKNKICYVGLWAIGLLLSYALLSEWKIISLALITSLMFLIALLINNTLCDRFEDFKNSKKQIIVILLLILSTCFVVNYLNKNYFHIKKIDGNCDPYGCG